MGDERFQEFCHTLITKEFQNTQAFPVGQPDGGRDSLAYISNTNFKEFIVFQVKFVRNPSKIEDPHKWLLNTIAGEVEKINELIPMGAKYYYLVTNVKGTAHLENGSIDKMQKLLQAHIKVPAMCWWRDDLSRKIEANPIIKWSYPEILNGVDILSSIVFQNLGEERERRENTIRAYLADQYDIDNEVKFKQIDLKNRLLDPFVDVPLRLKKFNENSKNKKITRVLSGILYNHKYLFSDEHHYLEERESIGAVSFLLNKYVQKNIDKMLIEGGPGQGKSTISQFLCQVHRIRLLNKKYDLQLLPDNFKNTPVRLPFKIDLRDLASWVESRNPYPESASEEIFKQKWKESLESFLLAHICYHSKFEDFNQNDLISIFGSPTEVMIV